MQAERRLFVLRHAKSSWDDPGLDDHERPLAPRGRRATELLSRYVRSHGIAPALVLCSTARRTRETLEGVAPGGRVDIDGDLYGADAEDILERLRRVPADTPSVMVIGHNPALQMLVLRLARTRGIDGRRRCRQRGPRRGQAQVPHRARLPRSTSTAHGPTWTRAGPASPASCARAICAPDD